MSALTDMQIAGVMMKIGVGLTIWLIITILFFRWYSAEEVTDAVAAGVARSGTRADGIAPAMTDETPDSDTATDPAPAETVPAAAEAAAIEPATRGAGAVLAAPERRALPRRR